MRKPSLVAAALVAALLPNPSQAQTTQKTMWAFHAGFVIPEEESFYVDDPVDAWLDREMSFLFGATLYRMASENFWYGPYAEIETIDLDVETGTRLGGGFAFSGRYPARGTGLQAGGTLGLSHASAGDFDSQFGIDYSMAVGLVFPISPAMDLGIHAVGFHGWYGGGDVPEGVLNSNARVRVQLQMRR